MINKANKSTRLPMLAGLPTRADIANLLAAARKRGQLMQLPWVVEAKGTLYVLGCVVEPEMIDPQWTLSAGGVLGGLATNLVWTHSTIDLDLILTLTSMESELPAEQKDAAQSLSELKEIIAADRAKGKEDLSRGSNPRGSSGSNGPNSSVPSHGQPPIQPHLQPHAQPHIQPHPAKTVHELTPQSRPNPTPEPPAPTSWSQIPVPGTPAVGAPSVGAAQSIPPSPALPPPLPLTPSLSPGLSPLPLPPTLLQAIPPPPTLAAPAVPQPQAAPVTATHSSPPPPSMQGNLAEIMPLGLLQTLAMGKKTGKLIVEHGNEHLEVFFNDGVVVHAASRQGDGELGILELFILNDGNYIFIPDERTTERTVSRPINSIITECMALVDKHQFLTKAGLKMSSYLTRTNLSLTESDFDGLTKNAPCPNRELLKAFFQQIDQHSRFFELLRKFPISKLDWLPILYALVTTNLIEISDKPSQAARLADLGSLGIDMTVVRDAYNSILRPETGVMGFPLFLHFLEQEYYRFETSRIPFTLLVLDVSLKDSKTLHALPEQAVRNLAQLIEQEKRKIDILGHFQKYEFAMILPATGVAGGLVFANKLQEVISESTICGAGPETAVSCFCGIAALPEDSSKVELLLPAALEAKKNAHETGKAVVAFKNLYQSG